LADFVPSPEKRVWLYAGLASACVLAVLVYLLWPSSRDELLVEASGGEGTTSSADMNAFGDSARNLTNDERRVFEIGDSFFTQNWVTAPSSTDIRDGLGPLLNAHSCSSCHLLDGRGSPEAEEPGLLLRLSVPGEEGPQPDPVYGDQLQDEAILGVEPEGTVRIVYIEESGAFADGTEYTLRRPVHDIDDLAYGPLSVDVMTSPRLAPPVFGAGLLEAIPESDIVAASDPDDSDADGISGRPNYLLDAVTGETVLGRFGWKANVPTVAQQVSGAFLGDIGITSAMRSEENCTIPQKACLEAPNGGNPEINGELFADVVFYNKTLAVPARRNLDEPDVVAGAGLFLQLGCDLCHQPRQETGDDEIKALAQQVIYPYTDLLLHDMGPDLSDDRPDGSATGAEWRTPPLWGLGLNAVVNGHEFYLHDGRARSVEEAILWHDGEASSARDAFKAISAIQRNQLLEFLDSL
jgi:CxxC motif-containing protein (DUF1111 family)